MSEPLKILGTVEGTCGRYLEIAIVQGTDDVRRVRITPRRHGFDRGTVATLDLAPIYLDALPRLLEQAQVELAAMRTADIASDGIAPLRPSRPGARPDLRVPRRPDHTRGSR